MRIGILISVITLLISCKPQPIFESEMTIQDNQWSYSKSFDSSFGITDVEKKYDLLLDITHDSEYEYENLYVEIATSFPKDTTITSLLSLELADKRGNWKGKCNSAECMLRFYLQEKFTFKDEGEYKIVIKQNSRKDNISGIKDLKLSLYQTEG